MKTAWRNDSMGWISNLSPIITLYLIDLLIDRLVDWLIVWLID